MISKIIYIVDFKKERKKDSYIYSWKMIVTEAPVVHNGIREVFSPA